MNVRHTLINSNDLTLLSGMCAVIFHAYDDQGEPLRAFMPVLLYVVRSIFSVHVYV